jgi:hypothetical protein
MSDRQNGGGEFAELPLRDDNPSEVDLLGFEDIVQAVEGTVTKEDLHPITVGIHAPWGGGKTTVLELLRGHLGTRSDLVVVYVSPWEYDKNVDPKAALIDAVLSRLQQVLSEERSGTKNVLDRLDSLRRRVKLTKAIKLAATTALTATLPSIDDLIGLFSDEDRSSDPTLQGFREQFGEFISQKELAHIERVVVLVDDLDRSLPDTVVETLEAIKLFLSVKKMAFVIAADEDNVARAIGQRLASTGQPTRAREYLEKIVHIPFTVPALSPERTVEYLALLMLADATNVKDLIQRVRETRTGDGRSLASRLDALVEEGRRSDVSLAERLAPVLHRQTRGNPRRLKRFLNAYWLRTSFAKSRGVILQAEAVAKLMVMELLYPDLFAQMLGWLAAGLINDKVVELERGEGDYPEQFREWAQLEPLLADVDLQPYMLLAASLRGDTVEQAALPPELRDIAGRLASETEIVQKKAIRDAAKLGIPEKSIVARYVAGQLRHQRTPERQKSLAIGLSALADDTAVAMTAVEELRHMDSREVLAPVPLGLLVHNKPDEYLTLIRAWQDDSEAPEPTRRAAAEALKGV